MKRFFVLLLALAALAACADEDPTSVGGPLLPGGAVRTFERVYALQEFLVSDTSATGYSSPAQADTLLVAREFAGTLNANALLRFVPAPATVLYRTPTDSLRVDSMPTYVSARFTVRIDTTRFAGERPIRFALYRIGEAWDPASATWTHRVDTLGTRLEWSVPGGTPAVLLDTASWVAGTDSISIPVDTQTIRLWSDTTSAVRGALLVAETPGVRVRVLTPVIRLKAIPSARPDTLVDVGLGALRRTYVFDPPPPPPGGDLRVGGTPAWRAFLRFRDRPQDFALPEGVNINYAALVLTPVDVPAAYAPEDSVLIDARSVFESPLVPLTRSPLSSVVGRLSRRIPPGEFAGGSGATYELPITAFFANLMAPRADTAAAPARTLALLSTFETRHFGFAEFAARNSPTTVRLRVVYSGIEPQGFFPLETGSK